jgi:hypothetical protein
MEEIDLDWETHKYCFGCGKEMGPIYQEEYGFNRSTGKPVLMYIKQCPDFTEKRWNDHDRAVKYDNVQ